jgi:hypothetical protein
MKQIIIYKITDGDDKKYIPRYYTLKGLRNYILNDMWDYWYNIGGDGTNDFSKKEIEESDEYLFAYLDRWRYQVERILITDDEQMFF